MRLFITVVISIVLGITPLPTIKNEPPSSQEPTAPKITVIEEKVMAYKPTPLADMQPIVDTAVIKEATAPPAPSQPVDNESIAWNFLISQGFTRNQTAGIMGNLQQEHSFNTTDVPGGLGIAQWMGNRRDNLLARANPYDINTQLQFMVEEMNGSVTNIIKSVDSVESSALTFSGKFERCGTCMNDQRIQYGYAILARH